MQKKSALLGHLRGVPSSLENRERYDPGRLQAYRPRRRWPMDHWQLPSSLGPSGRGTRPILEVPRAAHHLHRGFTVSVLRHLRQHSTAPNHTKRKTDNWCLHTVQTVHKTCSALTYTAKSYVLNQNRTGSDTDPFTFWYRRADMLCNRTFRQWPDSKWKHASDSKCNLTCIRYVNCSESGRPSYRSDS